MHDFMVTVWLQFSTRSFIDKEAILRSFIKKEAIKKLRVNQKG